MFRAFLEPSVSLASCLKAGPDLLCDEVGTKLTVPAQGGAVIQLLPGQYSTQSGPPLLHNAITEPTTSLSASAGFENSSNTLTLPLNVVLSPGVAAYTLNSYAGKSSFAKPPTTPINNSVAISVGSLVPSTNVWAVLSVGDNQYVLWDPVPDVLQFPSQIASNAVVVHDIQSSLCSPPCSSAGVCSPSATCTCPTGFTGALCESCSPGFFGPTCQPCPDGCTSCDDGIAGTGQCLQSQNSTSQQQGCNCLNGVCNPNGTCTCVDGWTTSANGTACAACSKGFFSSGGNNCRSVSQNSQGDHF